LTGPDCRRLPHCRSRGRARPPPRDHLHDRRKRFAAGAGTYLLVGPPVHIADQLIKIGAVGFASATVPFVHFKDKLPYLIEQVLPLLREAGVSST